MPIASFTYEHDDNDSAISDADFKVSGPTDDMSASFIFSILVESVSILMLVLFEKYRNIPAIEIKLPNASNKDWV